MYMQKLCRNTRKENTNSGDLDIIGVTLWELILHN
jgi:hypothetical protein